MSLSAKRESLARIHGRYQRAGRPHKTRILDEFCATCGYHRKAALRLLNRPLRTTPPNGPVPKSPTIRPKCCRCSRPSGWPATSCAANSSRPHCPNGWSITSGAPRRCRKLLRKNFWRSVPRRSTACCVRRACSIPRRDSRPPPRHAPASRRADALRSARHLPARFGRGGHRGSLRRFDRRRLCQTQSSRAPRRQTPTKSLSVAQPTASAVCRNLPPQPLLERQTPQLSKPYLRAIRVSPAF